MPPIGRCSAMRCAHGRRDSTSGSSPARTPTWPHASISTACSRWTRSRLTFRRCSAACASSPRRARSQPMPEAVHLGSGKVRELYALGDDRLLLVASDRISTFDVVLPTEIPDKGRVLTGLSAFWFARTREIVPNHLIALRSDGRSTECRRLEMLPLECVVRGYITGSGWKDYQATGVVCGHELPEGLTESEKLPEPIFTPSTKALEGHDQNIDRDQAVELVGAERYDEVERVSLELYRFASEHAAERGILIADTKYEFGIDLEGGLVLADELFTPDSSRFWPAEE